MIIYSGKVPKDGLEIGCSKTFADVFDTVWTGYHALIAGVDVPPALDNQAERSAAALEASRYSGFWQTRLTDLLLHLSQDSRDQAEVAHESLVSRSVEAEWMGW